MSRRRATLRPVWLAGIIIPASFLLGENILTERPLWLRAVNVAAIVGIAIAVNAVRRAGAEERHRRITAELRAEIADRTALLEGSQRMARIGSFRWDARTHTNIWTDELFRIHGMEPSETAPAQGYRDLIHPDDFDAVHASLARSYETLEPYDDDYRVVLASGEQLWIHAHGEAVVDEDGTFLGLEGTCQDVTAAKEAELALAHLYEQERQVADDLRALDASKTTFLQAVSHELRTPLTAISGIASMIDGGLLVKGDGRYEDMVKRLVANAKRLGTLLDDLLDLDRLSRGIIEARRHPTDVGALVQSTVNEIDMRDHKLYMNGGGAIANVDAAQTERIVENLVANAVKHTPPGTPIWVKTIGRDDGVELVVEDAGPGVLKEIKETLFEPFVKDTRGHVPGTGIGLSLVYRLAEVHGGNVWVEDRNGGGASFHVFLPNTSERRHAFDAA